MTKTGKTSIQSVTVPDLERNIEKKVTEQEMKRREEERGPRKTRPNLSRGQS